MPGLRKAVLASLLSAAAGASCHDAQTCASLQDAEGELQEDKVLIQKLKPSIHDTEDHTPHLEPLQGARPHSAIDFSNLPVGWRGRQDQATGRAYYWQMLDPQHATTWDRPVTPAMYHSNQSNSVFYGKIPYHLILVSKAASLDAIQNAKVRQNIQSTITRNAGMKVMWFDDDHCHTYLQEHYDDELAKFFAGEVHGPYKSDLCRAAILHQEGGFYVDLDLAPVVPFRELVDADTTFMTAVCANGLPKSPTDTNALLNALMASAPRNPIMYLHLQVIRKYYRQGTKMHEGVAGVYPMGPSTLMDAMTQTLREGCHGETLEQHRSEAQFACGDEHVRLYREDKLRCGQGYPSEECPPERETAPDVAKYGIFLGEGTSRKLIGWSRFAGCESLGCDA